MCLSSLTSSRTGDPASCRDAHALLPCRLHTLESFNKSNDDAMLEVMKTAKAGKLTTIESRKTEIRETLAAEVWRWYTSGLRLD